MKHNHHKKSKKYLCCLIQLLQIGQNPLSNFFLCPFSFLPYYMLCFWDNWLLFTMWLFFSLHNFKCIYRRFCCCSYRFYWPVSLFAFVLSPCHPFTDNWFVLFKYLHLSMRWKFAVVQCIQSGFDLKFYVTMNIKKKIKHNIWYSSTIF